jgi:photosystem II stability/assembly factor-like uncharacterized protein
MKNIIYCLLFLSTTLSISQQKWELLNPKPTASAGRDVYFVSNTKGFILTSNELLYTTDKGENWQVKQKTSIATSMKFKDNIGVIVGYNGYILLTTDSGQTWTSQSTEINETLNSVSIIDSQTIIVSGKSNIYTTFDGGNTWTENSIPNNRVNKTFFVSKRIGHAATDDGQIFKTIDGGSNWYVTASYTNLAPNSFKTIYFKNADVGFATREHDEIFKTTNGGETWNEINSGISNLIYSIQFIDDTFGFAAGEYGMYKTVNGGDSWTRIAIESAHHSGSNMYGIFFFDENEGFSVGTRGRIAHTTDAGENWKLYSKLDSNISQIEILSNSKIIARSGSNFYKSENEGINWSYAGTPRYGAYTTKFDFIDENTGFCIAGGTVGTSSNPETIYKTLDGGITWNKTANFGLDFDYGAYSLEFINEKLGFISGGYNSRKTFKTIDGGEVWRLVIKESFNKIQFLDEKNGYASTVYRGVFKTSDGGENWTQILPNDLRVQSLHFIDENYGIIVGDNGIGKKTTDGGITWSDLNLPYYDFMDVKFFTKNIVFAYDDDGRILKSNDSGFSWEQIYQMYGLEDFAISKEGVIYLCGSYGIIYKSKIDIIEASLNVSEAKDITISTGNIECSISTNTNQPLTNLQIHYGKRRPYGNSKELAPNNINGNSFQKIEQVLNNLESDTEYQYQLRGFVGEKSFTSKIGTFRTLKNYEINIHYITEINDSSVKLSGSLTTNDKEIKEIGFEYGTDKEQLTSFILASPASVSEIGQESTINAEINNLTKETVYYVRIKATYDNEIVYSELLNFKTLPEYIISNYEPILSETKVTIRTVVMAYKDEISDIVIQYGIDKSFDLELTTSPNKVGLKTYTFLQNTLSNIDPSKVYHYRLKATQGDTEIYGPIGLFSFSEKVIIERNSITESREFSDITGIVFSSKKVLYNLGVEYGKTLDYGFFKNSTSYNAYPGNVVDLKCKLTNLEPNTTYHYRIKSNDNQNKNYYSDDGTFTTLKSIKNDNFKIQSTNETCIDKNNGILKIESNLVSNYKISIDGYINYFKEKLVLENLEPRTYNLCIQEVNGSTNYCFQAVIQESKPFTAISKIENSKKKRKVYIEVKEGTFPYSLFINDRKIKEFNSKEFSFDASNGDEITISSLNKCEGDYHLKIENNSLDDKFTNPIGNNLVIKTIESKGNLQIEIFNSNGRLKQSFLRNIENNTLEINMSNFASGLYFIKILGETVRTLKIIKK